jgi:hypothetical protein
MELKTAITLVEIVVGLAVAILIGDFLGGRVGRARLAIGLGILVLVAIVAFAVYAAIVLSSG